MDDGKSTLIGRLLYGSNFFQTTTLAGLVNDSARQRKQAGALDFSLIADGLEAEREQGITIDVAYLFFATERRSFIVVDAPGHEQYTRNMATGASQADLAVILIDARKGLLTQTKRHTLLCSLLGIKHVVLAVNKSILSIIARRIFRRITSDYAEYANQHAFKSIVAVPVSAQYGDNITQRSDNTPWYTGPTLVHYLEAVETAGDAAEQPFRFSVQWVNRARPDFRGYAGTVLSGTVEPGATIVVASSGQTAQVNEILTYDGPLDSAQAGDAITITLKSERDIARGDLLSAPESPPNISDQFAAHVVWMSENPLIPGRSYLARIGTKTTPISITTIKYKLDVNTQEHLAARTLGLNDIAFCNLITASPVAFDPYDRNRHTGSFILIDRATNDTVGAGMISFGLWRGDNIRSQPLLVGQRERASIKHQRPTIVSFTGLPSAGKSTIANLVERRLHAAGHHTMMLDGDNLRQGLNNDLGFTEADRVQNVRRAGEIAKLMLEAGLIVLCAFISPYRAERDAVRRLVATGEFVEVHVDTPIEECMRRDTKGLYAKARAGMIKNFTGFDAPMKLRKRLTFDCLSSRASRKNWHRSSSIGCAIETF